MVIFNSYVKLPEGKFKHWEQRVSLSTWWELMGIVEDVFQLPGPEVLEQCSAEAAHEAGLQVFSKRQAERWDMTDLSEADCMAFPGGSFFFYLDD